VPIYFGGEGWTFPEPGDYEVRARLQASDNAADTVSEAVQIGVVDAHAPEDEAALQPLLTDARRLDDAVGRLLSFGGRIVSEDGLAELEATANQYGDTALGSALRLTLVSQRLRPPIDPLTGERPPPDLSEARELLRDTCTDSGIAALKAQLLARHSGGIPRNLTDEAETEATAWEGTSSVPGAARATYSDPALEQWGPSLHFCLNESQLRDRVRAEIPHLVRELRDVAPTRMVIVGHGDYEGSCRHNDLIGLHRAEAVRHALVAGGLRVQGIDVASLGERRPLDFASTSAAHDLNRRVEILIEGGRSDAERSEPATRVAPRCPPESRGE